MNWFVFLGFTLFITVIAVRHILKRKIVHVGTIGLLYRRGIFVRELAPGLHRYWDIMGNTRVVIVPTVQLSLHHHEVSVISKDQFSFRIGLTPIGTVRDARAYHEAQLPSSAEHSWDRYGLGLNLPLLSPALNAAAIDHVSRLTLDEFMADPKAGLEDIRLQLGDLTPGVEITSLLLNAITMPPEVRKMFTEVERAKREGLAALERARAEQASLRALANAARALQSNPQLSHLRMLQTMENARGAKTFIVGNAAALPLASDGNSEAPE